MRPGHPDVLQSHILRTIVYLRSSSHAESEMVFHMGLYERSSPAHSQLSQRPGAR